MEIAVRYLPRYTVKICERWKGNWELIEGIAYALASRSFLHQRIVGRLFRFLDEEIEEKCEECTVGIDTDYVIDVHTVVRPEFLLYVRR